MIEVLQSKVTENKNEIWYKFQGESYDIKPVGEYPKNSGKYVANGSRFFENGTEILYELNGSEWSAVGQEPQQTVVLEDVTITPSTSQQTVTAGEEYNGIGTVTVEAVTPAIDKNILSENIKYGAIILGVSGTYLGEDPAAAYELAGMIQRNVRYVGIPSGVTRIGDHAFAGCSSLQEMVLAENDITSIGAMAFAGCIQLNDIILSDSTITIGDFAFSNCQSLTSIEIPDSVTSIGENAFMMCTNLEYIEIHKEEDSISGAPWGATNAEIVWTG